MNFGLSGDPFVPRLRAIQCDMDDNTVFIRIWFLRPLDRVTIASMTRCDFMSRLYVGRQFAQMLAQCDGRVATERANQTSCTCATPSLTIQVQQIPSSRPRALPRCNNRSLEQTSSTFPRLRKHFHSGTRLLACGRRPSHTRSMSCTLRITTTKCANHILSSPDCVVRTSLHCRMGQFSRTFPCPELHFFTIWPVALLQWSTCQAR